MHYRKHSTRVNMMFAPKQNNGHLVHVFDTYLIKTLWYMPAVSKRAAKQCECDKEIHCSSRTQVRDSMKWITLALMILNFTKPFENNCFRCVLYINMWYTQEHRWCNGVGLKPNIFPMPPESRVSLVQNLWRIQHGPWVHKICTRCTKFTGCTWFEYTNVASMSTWG